MIQITKQWRAEIAHRLPNHPGRCQFIHGHSYLFEITVSGTPDNDGMIMDFSTLKKAVEECIGHWDHSLILVWDDPIIEQIRSLQMGVSLVPFPCVPTAENMAAVIGTKLRSILEVNIPIKFWVEAVKVWETTTSYAEWKREVVHA